MSLVVTKFVQYLLLHCLKYLFTITFDELFYKFQINVSFADVSANILYDVLHDAKYRKAWDPNVVDCFEICRVSCNSDIGYYSSKNFFVC